MGWLVASSSPSVECHKLWLVASSSTVRVWSEAEGRPLNTINLPPGSSPPTRATWCPAVAVWDLVTGTTSQVSCGNIVQNEASEKMRDYDKDMYGYRLRHSIIQIISS